jgi:hypothetical protein
MKLRADCRTYGTVDVRGERASFVIGHLGDRLWASINASGRLPGGGT